MVLPRPNRRGIRTLGRAALVVAPLALFVACGLGSWRSGAAGAAPGVDPSAGETVWDTDCAYCHGGRGEGTFQGPSVRDVGTASVDFMVRTGRMPRPIDAPGQPSTAAGARGRYDEATIASLVAFVAPFVSGPPAVASVDVADADVARGGELYRLNCAACHQSVGRGGVLAYGTEVPPLLGSSPRDVVEAMRVGPGSMPVFDTEVLDDADAAAIAAYLAEVRHPEDRGGWGLWHLGPVPEGLIGWALGIVPAVLLCRWLGTRTPPKTTPVDATSVGPAAATAPKEER